MALILSYLLIFLLALVVRLIYLTSIIGDPMFATPIVDSAVYLGVAESLARGDGFPPGPLRFGPLYPMLLGAAFKLTGGGTIPLHFIQVLFTSLTAPLLALAGKHVFNKQAGLLTGVLAGIYWPMVYFDGEFLIEPALLPIVAGLLIVLLAADRRPSNKIYMGAGLLMGIIGIARPNLLLLAPVWAVRLLIGKRPIAALLLIVGATLPIVPVTVRNMTAGDDFVLISSTGGINFYIGNNENATGRDSTFPGLFQWTFEKVQKIAEHEAGRSLRDSEVSRHYFQKGLEFARQKPGAFAMVTARKVIQTFSSYEMPNVKDPGFQRERSWFLGLPFWPGFGILFPLAVLGVIRVRGRQRTTLLLFALTTALSIVLFFVNGRYRLPMVPVLLLLGGAGLATVLELLRSRGKGISKKIRLLATFLIALVLVNLNPLGRLDDRSQLYFNVGWAAQKQGESQAAIEEYNQVARGSRWYPPALNNKAILFRDSDRLKEARAALLEATEIDSTYFEGWATLGSVLYREQDFGGAVRAYKKAVDLWPFRATWFVNLGLARRNTGDWGGALAEYDRALAQDGEFVKAMLHKGEILIALQRYGEAVSLFEETLRIAPAGSPEAKTARAALRGLESLPGPDTTED